MRIPVISVLLLAIVSTGIAQTQPAVKADPEATRAGKYDIPISTATESKSTVTVSIPKEKPLFADPETRVVAKWDGGELTNTEVSATLTTRRPATLRVVSPEQFATMPRPQQVDAIKQMAYEQILLAKARKEGINEQTPDVATAIAKQADDLLNRLYYTQKIEPRLNELATDAAEEYYNKNKDKLFTRPAVDVLRGVHVSTYEMVTAEQGDTLESLAKSITGSTDAAADIRSATAPFYLRQTPTELQDKVLSSPLKGGEVLYVPMGEDAVASATAFAESLRKELAAGKSIDEVAATKSSDYTVSATQPIRIEPHLPYYDELKAAAEALDSQTTLSPVVKTPAGLDILVLQDRETTQVVPYETVKDQILQKVTTDEARQREAIEETRQETLDRLWKKYDVKINEQAISRPNYAGTDPLTSDTVIAETGDFKYTLDEYLRDLRLTGKGWGQLTKQERMDILKIAPSITRHLVAKDARALGLDKTDEFREMMRGVSEALIVAKYNQTQAKPEDSHVTTEELRAFYNDHLDNYTSPAQVTLREISKRINMTLPPAQKAEEISKAKKALEEIRSRIHNQEDFIQLARRESEAISTRSRGGLIGTVGADFRGEAFKNQLRQMKPGDVSEPFLYGSEVMIVRMDERIPPTAQPFETVTRQVMRDYARTVPKSQREQERDNTLEAANFQLLF